MNDRARHRMERAKAMYTRAARAALDGLPMAPAMAKAALEELNAARAEPAGDDATENQQSLMALLAVGHKGPFRKSRHER